MMEMVKVMGMGMEMGKGMAVVAELCVSLISVSPVWYPSVTH